MVAKERQKKRARIRLHILTGATLGLYFGLFFRPARDEASLSVIIALSLLGALLMTLLRLRQLEHRSRRKVFRYALKTWISLALFLGMLEGRHLAHDLGGRLATSLFTTFSGAGLGLWYAKMEEQKAS